MAEPQTSVAAVVVALLSPLTGHFSVIVFAALPEVEMLLSQLVTLGALTGARKTAILAALPEAT